MALHLGKLIPPQCPTEPILLNELTVRLIAPAERARFDELLEREHYLHNPTAVGAWVLPQASAASSPWRKRLTKENEKSNLPVLSGHQEARKLISIEKRSAQILVVLLLASLWFQSWAVSLGLILGGGIALLNFHWLRSILSQYVMAKKKYSLFQLIGKFFILLLVLFLVICFARVNPVALVVGVSTLVLGIVIEVLRQSLGKNRKGVW